MRSALLIAAAFIATPALAITPDQLHLHVEPIVGVNWTQRTVPTPHVTGEFVYGGRVSAGVPLLSLEAEYTHGVSQETYLSPDLQIRDTDDRGKLGLVSEAGLGGPMSGHLRAGAQASRNKHEETTAGVTSVLENPVHYDPYAGAGFRFSLTPQTYFSADLTVVFNDVHDMSKNEYQTSAGFAIRLP
jgi:hypothetical protein